MIVLNSDSLSSMQTISTGEVYIPYICLISFAYKAKFLNLTIQAYP
jgi:hypothetical protein